MSENRIAFIIPYFGKFNNYFNVWLHSCKYNASIDWLIFTDDHTLYDYPENVKVHYTTFEETKSFIQSKFDFPIELKNPYLICEFRLAFGEVYEEYLSDYDFWGFCDTDVIFGNLRRHISAEILSNYSKISWRGHLTLFRNNKHINSLYKNKIEGIDFYKYAFTNKTGFPLASDEREINYIFEEAGEKVYKELIFADLQIRSYNFQISHFAESEQYKNKSQVFYWEHGELYRIYVYNSLVFKENFAYVHFLKRDMQISKVFDLKKNILIIPNKFISVEKPPEVNEIVKYSEQRFYLSYFLSRISIKYIKSKINYYKSRKHFRSSYSFLPQKPTHVILPNTSSEKLN